MQFKDFFADIKEHKRRYFFLSDADYTDDNIQRKPTLTYTYNGITRKPDTKVTWKYLYVVDGEKALHPTAIEGHQFLTITEMVTRIDLKEVKNGRSNIGRSSS